MRFSQNDLHFSVEMVAVELGQFPPDILIINLLRLPKLRLKFGSIRGALHFKSLCNKAYASTAIG